jgi:hypothetical protein
MGIDIGGADNLKKGTGVDKEEEGTGVGILGTGTGTGVDCALSATSC